MPGSLNMIRALGADDGVSRKDMHVPCNTSDIPPILWADNPPYVFPIVRPDEQ